MFKSTRHGKYNDDAQTYYSCYIGDDKSLSTEESHSISRIEYKNEKNLNEALRFHRLNLVSLPDNIFSIFPKLNFLLLSDLKNLNELKPENFKNAESLRKCWVNDLKIRYLQDELFVGAQNLQYLTFDSVNLEMISEHTLSGLSELKGLYLQRNKIKVLSNRVFHWLSNLEEIFLDQNKLKMLPRQLFAKNPKLKIVLLNNNEILAIHPKIFVGNKVLTNVDMVKNKCINKNFEISSGNMKTLMNSLTYCMNNYTLITAIENDDETPKINSRTSLANHNSKADLTENDSKIHVPLMVFVFQGIIFVLSIILFGTFGCLYRKIQQINSGQ